jgi:hypothetical protein
MLSLRKSAAMHLAAATHPDPRFRELLTLRLGQFDQGDGTDLGELVHIVVFEAGDTLDELEAILGFTPLHNDGASYGDSDFTPGWEWIMRHDRWIELVWIHSDFGNGAILFVQDADDVEPRLISLCNEFAESAKL